MNEQEILQMLGEVGAVITDSHIVYTSGRHGTAYVNKDAIYPYTRRTSKLCRETAEFFAEQNVEVVVAPAVGGVILSQWTAFHLSEIYDRDVLAVYAERDEESLFKADDKSRYELDVTMIDPSVGRIRYKTGMLKSDDEVVIKHPGFVIKRGYDKLVAGKRVLAVEDVATTGGSIKKVIEVTRRCKGNVIGAALLCNRGNVTPNDIGDPPILHALLNVKFDSWSEEECRETGPCSRGVNINTAVGKGKDFLARQKG
ncbi:MAG: phosphoribosyltransferase family protein [Patescibacteria group bacterium]|jgi:orotate phosphoribosyltransferase